MKIKIKPHADFDSYRRLGQLHGRRQDTHKGHLVPAWAEPHYDLGYRDGEEEQRVMNVRRGRKELSQ